MEGTNEKAYSPKEMSMTLDIGDSTLRKWAISLEKNGYVFIRNDQNNRLFIESDLAVLKYFKELVKTHNMQLDNASKLVIERFGIGSFEKRTDIVPLEKENEHRNFTRSNDEVINQLLEHIRTQKEFNQELLRRLDRQQNYIEERLNARDQTLLKSLKEVQETKKLIAVTQDEAKKKRFFARLFNK